MSLAQSRLTAQGQISIPAEVRRRLGLVPGSVLEWIDEGENVVVRRVGRYSSEDIHVVLFADGAPSPQNTQAFKEGIRSHIKKKHARG